MEYFAKYICFKQNLPIEEKETITFHISEEVFINYFRIMRLYHILLI